MPDDLLRYLSGPTGYGWCWPALAGLLLAVVTGWCLAVYVWTLPASRLRAIPLVRVLHRQLVRRKFVRAIDDIRSGYRGGALDARQTGAALSATVRSFLSVSTGDPAQYMHLGDLAGGRLAAAAPLVAALGDVQFNDVSRADVDALAASARELVASWS